MSTLLDEIKAEYSPDVCRDMERVLEAMGLPDPAHGEYIEGNLCKLLFLKRYGLVLRVGHVSDAPVEHDLVLKRFRASGLLPIRVRDAADFLRDVSCAIELLPGVDGVLKSEKDMRFLSEALEADNVSFWDYRLYNGGYLQSGTPGFPDGLPVIIDRGAVRRVTSDRITAKFNRAVWAGVQEKYFAPLHEPLAASWPEGAKLPIKGMGDFLAACAAEIAKRERGEKSLLSSDWAKHMPPEEARDRYQAGKSLGAVSTAAAYERRLSLG